MSVGSRIKELRESKQITRSDLADLLGVTVGAISNYENEVSSPKEPILFKIMECLNCDANYLFQDALKMPGMENTVSIDEYKLVEKYRFIAQNLPDGAKVIDTVIEREHAIAEQLSELRDRPVAVIDFPQHSSQTSRAIQYFYSASAGTGQVIFDDVYSERISIPDIPEYRRVAYAVKVSGHSMEPLYDDGDMLLIEPTCTVDVGEIGIFNVGGQAYVKKLGETELISLNEGYGNIPLTEDARCMGRVVDKYQDGGR